MPPAEGSVGAGAGATVGKLHGLGRAMKGGIGTASARVGGITVGAIVAVNAVGDIVDPTSARLIAGLRSADGRRIVGTMPSLLRGEVPAGLEAGMATTLGCVATDAMLDKAQACKLAQMAHDGLARAIDPVHTMYDGDTVFALATGASGRAGNLSALGAIAAAVMATAVVRAARGALGADVERGVAVARVHLERAPHRAGGLQRLQQPQHRGHGGPLFARRQRKGLGPALAPRRGRAQQLVQRQHLGDAFGGEVALEVGQRLPLRGAPGSEGELTARRERATGQRAQQQGCRGQRGQRGQRAHSGSPAHCAQAGAPRG
jgi:hypothetical protein